jgi:3-methyladenine DNA glycosylase AlkD
MNYAEVMQKLSGSLRPDAIKGMEEFGIKPRDKIYGLSVPEIRNIAKSLGKNHPLALRLWKTNVHEAKLLAPMIDDPRIVTEQQMEAWVADFDSWDTCDGCCGNLFDKTKFAHKKAIDWTLRTEEFVKRAGYVLMAELAVHDKPAPDSLFIQFIPYIKKGSTDERNFVKKAVNWALRQIGKRNVRLNSEAILAAESIYSLSSRSARWIAVDALRELKSPTVLERLKK